MKNRKLLYITLVLAVMVFTNCQDEFLEVAPTSSLSSAELSTEAGLTGTLNGAYSILLGRGGFYTDATNWVWGSILGGDANKGTNAGDQSQINEIQAYSSQTNNGSVLGKYSRQYEGVARCNATIGLATGSEIVSDAFRTRIIAEARFLRGHYYFELKKVFNNTPYVDETWDEVTPVSNASDLWPFIEADFKFAMDNLPETQGDAGRANKWAAAAYLGKTYLYQGKWSEAESVLNQVVASGTTANGQPYELLENYANAFRSTFDNSSESVFSSQAAANTGTINNANPGLVLNFPHGSAGPTRPGGCCGFFQPSFDLVNSYRTTADGLPLLDNSYNSDPVADDMGLASSDDFTADGGNLDPRVDHSVGRRGIPYLDWGPHPGVDWIRDQAYGGPYSPKKFIYYQGGVGTENDGSSWTPGYTAVNYNIIRFADVLLMAAEAKIEQNNLAEGMALINRVRSRAMTSFIKDADGNDAANYVVNAYSSFADQSEARAAVRFERKLELSGEGHRFFDLVRWGIAAEVLNAYLEHEDALLTSPFAGASFSANKSELQPIPQNEIDLQGTDMLSQNPGY